MATEIIWSQLTSAQKFQVIKTNPLIVPPKTKVISKDSGYAFWKLVDILWKILTLGKGSFLTRTTALGPYVAFRKGWKEEEATDRDCGVLVHEAEHMKQRIKLGGKKSVWLGSILYVLLYLFFPLPIFFSYFRYKWEREAYLAQWKAPGRFGLDVEYDLNSFVGKLTGRPYFWAWHSKKSVRDWFLRNCFSK